MSQFKALLFLCVFLKSINSYSQTSLFNQQMQIGFEEKQGQYADLNVRLVNEAGDTVLLKDVINKPTILSDRKSTRLNSSHANISYAVFCLQKKKECTVYSPTDRLRRARSPGCTRCYPH